MKLKDFIKELQKYNPELPVCITGRERGWCFPDEVDTYEINLVEGEYFSWVKGAAGGKKRGEFLKIGDD